MSVSGFNVTVIVPVFNAAATVRTAVESALMLPETREVLLVEDGSPDGAIDVCREILKLDARIKLFQHPGGVNKGAGASRNLGIVNANCEFIAFLDADDWYLPNRFLADSRILCEDNSVDGVYNASGHHFESEALRKVWLSQGYPEILTFNKQPSYDELPLVLLNAHSEIRGGFNTNCITVRRRFFQRIGVFDERLRLRQDIHLWFRMSVLGVLVAGQIESPVAVQRVHPNNRMTRIADHIPYADLWWRDIGQFLHSRCRRHDINVAWRRGFCYHLAGTGRRAELAWNLLKWSISHPRVIAKADHDFDTVVRTGFPNSQLINRMVSGKNRLLRMSGIQR
jgi:glycosyltransferase involved in cell wall biosynthesis